MLDAVYRDLAATVTGNAGLQAARSDRAQTTDAISEILAFYHCKAEIPDGVEPVSYVTETLNISCRTVFLEGDWYKDAIGPYLGRTTDGQTIAILPKRNHYEYYDRNAGRRVRVNRQTVANLEAEAQYFYLPLPAGKLTLRDLYRYMLKSLTVWDYAQLIGATALASVLAMPAGFFKQHASGEVASQLNSIDNLTAATVKAVFSSGLTGLFSLIYIAQISAFAPALTVPAVIVLVLKTALSLACVVIGVKRTNLTVWFPVHSRR